MDAVDVARWQFAITTVYHFLFVPVTIGLSAIVAAFHTGWVRTHRPEYLRLTKLFGKLFAINFALGLVTGIVQEFQFGMNWSAYSRFVGDVFGAPLALEALLAFFLESTFLGLWLFGWGRVPERLHAATMWVVHLGTVLSAYFILAANSFMQNPVGFRFDAESGRAEMTDFVAVLTNRVQLVTFPHVILASYMVGGAVVMGVGLWLLRRERRTDDEPMYRRAVRVGAVVTLVAGLGVTVTGDVQGKVMTEVQPMKMAAAEALYETQPDAPFSVLSIGSLDGTEATRLIEVPGLLSFLATGTWDGEVEGIDPLRESERVMAQQVAERYGPEIAPFVVADDYAPVIPLAYWSFRFMMGLGFLSMAFAAATLWFTRGTRVPTARWWVWVAVLASLAPLSANSWGWIFTETGRQPWVVYGLMTTTSGVSPSVGVTEVWVSMLAYTLVYAALAVVELKLFIRYVRRGADPFEDPRDRAVTADDADAPLQVAY
ncbi:MAG: cytochrome ubiquinol oxidase subunit I [Phycicoccus sp.]